MPKPDPDYVHRTVLLSMHDGTALTVEGAEAAHAATGIIIVGDDEVCRTDSGQAAMLTAIATATRAFGHVYVLVANPPATITTGLHRGSTLAAVANAEGARLITVDELAAIDDHWPTLLIGSTVDVPARRPHAAPVMRAQWNGWTATVAPALRPSSVLASAVDSCILAAVAAGALGVSEAFNLVLARPGNDAGYRFIGLNLWDPGTPENDGPLLHSAPAHWWLVGLGHLGQAYSWVLSWLNYDDPTQVQVVLQDTDRTTPATRSTGLLTPIDSHGVLKTRLVADALDSVGFDTRIVERRLDGALIVTPADVHVALVGVDNVATRRLISSVGWRLAIDAGLGNGPHDFSSILLRRFPGGSVSTEVAGWSPFASVPKPVPDSPAFADLARRIDACGLVELAGKAVGAAFVGTVAATLVVAEAIKGLHGGHGADITTLRLDTMDLTDAPATALADVVALPLRS